MVMSTLLNFYTSVHPSTTINIDITLPPVPINSNRLSLMTTVELDRRHDLALVALLDIPLALGILLQIAVASVRRHSTIMDMAASLHALLKGQMVQRAPVVGVALGVIAAEDTEFSAVTALPFLTVGGWTADVFVYCVALEFEVRGIQDLLLLRHGDGIGGGEGDEQHHGCEEGGEECCAGHFVELLRWSCGLREC